jgi:t-SNARE complex subunit (syntaxin)
MSFADLERGLATGNATAGNLRGGRAHNSGDNDRQYKSLSQRISQQVFKITNNVASINRMVGQLGSARDTQELRNQLHGVTESTRDLVKNTSNDIKELSRYDGGQNRQRKLEQQKLSKDFQKTLQEFQKAQRLSAEKQREYVDKAKAYNVRNDVYTDEDEPAVAEEQPLIDDTQRRMQLQVVDNEIEYNESLIAEREEEIREIEHGINELNEIFRDLGTLVTEQQSMLDNIESNVSSLTGNVRNAVGELDTARQYQKKAGNRVCLLLLIFAVIGVVVLLTAFA